MGITSKVKTFFKRREQENIRKAKIQLLKKAFKYILDGRYTYICYALSGALTTYFFIGKIKRKARDELNSFIYSALKGNRSLNGYAYDVLKNRGEHFDIPELFDDWIWLKTQRMNWIIAVLKALERKDSVLPDPIINTYPDDKPWKENGN